MRALIIYPSQGGQTEHIARRIATRMTEEGARVDLYNIADEPADEIAVDAYDAVILGSPSHYGHHDARIEWCIREYRQFLSEVPTAFFSVSHQAAGRHNGDGHDVCRCADDFVARLRWQPSMTRTFPGVKRYDHGGLWQRLMHWTREKPGEESEVRGNEDSIDWYAVDDFAQRFTRFIFSCKQPPETRPRFSAWLAHPKHEFAVVASRR